MAVSSSADVPGQGFTTWKKSTRSNGGDACVEVAPEQVVGVRDTKEKGLGPVLTFSPAAWSAFTAAVVADGSPLAGGF